VPDCPLDWDPGLSRCRRIAPTGFLALVWHDLATGRLLVDDGELAVVNTDTGEIVAPTTARPAGPPGEALGGIWFDVVEPSPGRKVALFGFRGIVVLAGGRVEVRGSRPAAFHVGGDVAVFGTIAAWTPDDSTAEDASAGGALQIAADGRISVFPGGRIAVDAPIAEGGETAGADLLLEAGIIWNAGTIRAGRGSAAVGDRVRMNFSKTFTEGSTMPPPEAHQGVETW
jgi:hypothetical protein